MNTQYRKVGEYALHSEQQSPTCEICVRLDEAGFVVDASHNANLIGIELQSRLFPPHIADFALGEHQQELVRYFQQVMAAEHTSDKVAFPLDETGDALSDHRVPKDRQWYSIELRRLEDDDQTAFGAIGTIELLQPNHSQFERTLIDPINDPLTGLADRRSFIGNLTSSIALNETVSVALFAIDGMRAIFIQHGHGTADEIRWGFARFLEAMTDKHHILAQVDEERFGVILPDMTSTEARHWANEALRVFAGLAMPSSGGEPELCASAGVARAGLSAEWTMRQAELGLVMARAAGGNCAAICQPHSRLSSGHLLERAMETVVENSSKRVG